MNDEHTAVQTTTQPPAHPSPTVTMSRQELLWWAAILLILGGVLGAGIVHLLGPEKKRLRTEPLPVLGHVSDFKLIDSSGDPVSRDDLAGRVWIADFFFTSCAGICPMMSKRMAELQDKLSDTREVTLVSISVDPERDTPERLRRYAAMYDADPVRWWFLTGERAAIYRLSHESFRLSVEEVPEDQREPGMEDVLHSSRFVLLDRQARIRGYYDGEDQDMVEQLAADIRGLLKE
jgi:protein SCO1/2